ncbi:hypothetical protein TPHA_0E01230 [Tetrapisispora phaffii CBS 4417]|uniref:dolichyl-phosphate-mannose--protein mannosyltransferase n=1 Tax=Tetrapisispora phaffii (strain ATCC 24235 / CBS 4417 / NBRC 1672 / NRRL Y-8282 / UCD 70-5) TaxID=1071381 RepID=G8BTJ0_TETPH|nr:hypothetical protein TPHA_0E01230 [Tetrapisispora phaffii CBS 4417]CCE63218.1 hypothetical protein TPHA_0E01230 [Tetrapisispora phaffii CBS 4417]
MSSMVEVADTLEKDKISRNINIEGIGPYRPYKKYNYLSLLHFGHLNTFDILISLIIIGYYYYYMLFNNNIETLNTTASEQEFITLLNKYREQIVYLNSSSSFPIYFYSLFPNEVILLRKVTLVLVSLFLGMSYLLLRRVCVSTLIAVLATVAISSVQIFQTHSLIVTELPLNWFLTTVAVYSWRSLKIYTPLTKAWFINILMVSISLGLSISSKHISFATYTWIIIVSLNELWNLISDINLSGKLILKVASIQTFFFVVAPIIIFAVNIIASIENFKHDDIAVSQYLPIDFQAHLRGGLNFTDKFYYGSIIKMRHVESLAGYLHSDEINYPSGSQEQLVSLSDQENDPNNEWIVEHQFANFDFVNRSVAVANQDLIRLRHRVTGKLLRGSTAKPPVSEEDYTSEISCTGDQDYTGDTDELWKLQVLGMNEKQSISIPSSIIQLFNVGHHCAVIGHEVRLPSWGLDNQEVLCIDPPNQIKTFFQISYVNYRVKNYKDAIVYKGNEKTNVLVNKISLMIDLIKTDLRYNSYIKNIKIGETAHVAFWPFTFTDLGISDQIWLSSIVAIIIFIGILTKNVLSWNPWMITTSNIDIMPDFSFSFKIELLMGWLLHFAPFFKAAHDNLHIIQYFHSFYFGVLLFVVLLNDLYRWNRLTLFFSVIYCVSHIYIYFSNY